MTHTHQVRWTVEKITQRIQLIEPLVYRQRQPLAPFRYTTLAAPMDPPPIGAEVDDSAWAVIKPGDYWGGPRINFALRGAFQVPDAWDADAPVALYLPLGVSGDFSHPETLVYIDGERHAASDRHHTEVVLHARWRDGKPHRLALHGWTGMVDWQPGHLEPQLQMHECAVVQIDQPMRDFIVTARVALGVVLALDENEPARYALLNALDAAFNALDTREPYCDRFYASVPQAHAALKEGVAAAGPPLDVTVVAAGHAHIDVAWLWTLGQTRRKSERSFHTVMRLMEQFPAYHFTQSQPQLYDYVRQDDTELFAAIKARVAEGRWEPIGGTWVETDCNITGPESLARQFVLGRAFFREHFGPGVDSPVLWLPDVFGYAWNLPQLIKQAGMDYFFTIKIGWNQYNRLPYDSFWWQGLDGTRVLTHFSTTPESITGLGREPVARGTYNAAALPQQIIGTWMGFQQKEHQRELLMAYGYGDGGGGPTREMLENIREMDAFPATPRVRPGKVIDFFRNMEAESGDRLPVWNGELYFELHRGTYTTQSRNKRANRKSEFLLHDAEFLCAWAALLDAGFTYPVDSLRKAWELVCLNQFHDIIPGSSIGPVYAESLQQYAEVREMGEAARDAALKVIADRAGRRLAVVNPTGFAREDLAFVPGDAGSLAALARADGAPALVQPAEGGAWVAAGALPPYSATPLTSAASPAAPPDTGLTATPTLLENNHVRVEFDAAGDIVRIYDKANGREVMPPGAVANQFQAFEDRPMNWDAWDVDIFYEDRMWLSEPAESVTVVEGGPLRATLEIRRRVLNSVYTQRISLAYNSPRLDFDTVIDWRERHILLKVAFPVDVLSPSATYEIQWGNVERPTHQNTSWDWARFEVCAQKWADLSEGGYGVSLLNDCKYGHDIKDNVMRLTLLRGTTLPDLEADLGEHRFAYSLLPHAGRWDETTVAAAYALNDPLIVVRGGGDAAAPLGAMLSANRPNIVIETVKRAEDGEGLVVRFYENQRRRGPVTLTAGFPLRGAWRTNLIEENQEALEVTGRSVQLDVNPYEIVTLRLLPA
ncbi:MAG: alpha-mannosidase [Anaerolineae bacterium]|nr:alpha-mannosidase [Anaerolineae bacterium]